MPFNVTRLTFERVQRIVLNEVELSLVPGELVGLLGPNGAGKSTLLAAMAGEFKSLDGMVELDGVGLDHLSTLEQARSAPL